MPSYLGRSKNALPDAPQFQLPKNKNKCYAFALRKPYHIMLLEYFIACYSIQLLDLIRLCTSYLKYTNLSRHKIKL